MKNVLKFLAKALGILGYSLLLASAATGYLAKGNDIIVVGIIGFFLLVLSLLVYWGYKALEDPPRNFPNVVFPDS